MEMPNIEQSAQTAEGRINLATKRINDLISHAAHTQENVTRIADKLLGSVPEAVNESGKDPIASGEIYEMERLLESLQMRMDILSAEVGRLGVI